MSILVRILRFLNIFRRSEVYCHSIFKFHQPDIDQRFQLWAFISHPLLLVRFLFFFWKNPHYSKLLSSRENFVHECFNNILFSLENLMCRIWTPVSFQMASIIFVAIRATVMMGLHFSWSLLGPSHETTFTPLRFSLVQFLARNVHWSNAAF